MHDATHEREAMHATRVAEDAEEPPRRVPRTKRARKAP
jgi:hypothetical protein